MKISYNWLKDFINLEWTPEQTEILLTDLGLEVEGIDKFESVKGGLEGIVVGEVLTCEPHQNADRLKVTTVNIGDDQPLQIVCGAPNVAAGQKVPVATIGTTLYTDKGEAWKIKKGKIRGEESHGMICAEDELGLGKSHEGILVLDEKLQPGTLLKDVFEVENDAVFEIGLTPNRADAMSHYGVARDLRAGLIQQGKSTNIHTPSVSSFHTENRSKKIKIEVENIDLAPRYCGLTISGIEVKPSPNWLKNKLKAIGLTPKNNIVDATNYVMHELGQPLHAFDADKIAGETIIVKTLSENTKFTTLDDVERKLSNEDLMICDTEKPLCIAGVLGGKNSAVSENTKNIFLESAYFNPVSIRKTAKRHAINSDASFRFERGIDPDMTKYVLKRAALLIKEIAGGIISSDITDLYPKKIEDFQVVLTFDKIYKILGQEIERETIKSILTSLDIKVNNVTESGLGLTIPSYRVDVTREVDVIEEILRVYGYNQIKTGTKLNASIANTTRFENYKIENIVAQFLVNNGFNEMMANSLTKDYSSTFENIDASKNVTMLNPLSGDLQVMRQSLLPSALEAVIYNLNRNNHIIKFFEYGKTYRKENNYQEQKNLSITVVGDRTVERWNHTTQKSDFFFLKGIINGIFTRLGLTLDFLPLQTKANFSEGLDVIANNKKIGSFGILKKKIAKTFDIDEEVLHANFNWSEIATFVKKQKIKYQDIPKYPSSRRDFALLLDQNVSFSEIYHLATAAEKKLLIAVDLFDVYEGKNLPEGKKSYAVSFTFRDNHKTLTDKQVDKIMAKLQKEFEEKLGATLR
ncbi:phenylalanine--tRNA ligase subunit beta [Mesonia sp. K7]|uniref:phenylalanine--tRNA ligase subunit beta n=1 Tax=Mesonia sp. K7 TaxID=2218606 RepID=UPI000DA92035|nr:phenylalanine--tRNA ligase subunit beta [Mesonia sp. K7]PZD79444.1 phenylalanine--tRNA ligase subunit beta [Mesonia sp. K7]